VRVAVLTISDRRSRGEGEDEGGPLIETMVTAAGWEVVARDVVPDERDRIEGRLRDWAASGVCDLIVSTGGTGLGPRDVTPEAVRAVIDIDAPGITELMRAEGIRHTPFAALSRQVAGVSGKTLIVTLPGSPKAIAEGLAAVLPILGHAVEMIHGGAPPA
jgi:molybdenum cofactor synthesis domain-containing protein